MNLHSKERNDLARVAELEKRIAKLEKSLDSAKAMVADMECSCLPHAKPSDGMCERCMFFFGFDEEEG